MSLLYSNKSIPFFFLTSLLKFIEELYIQCICHFRDKVEFNMTFLGMIVLQNKLKPETKPAIHKLREARIRTVMVTGKVLCDL